MTGPRKNIMLGTAGHVDHGKTALVKLLTGCETDTLAEEQQRGLTIDLGFAPCRLADERVVGVVDVPGHVDFIRNMVAGAHGVDVVIFVVAADDGIMPQTHEHLHILTLMGLRHGLVALTKIDLVEPPRRQAVSEDLRRLLGGTFLANAPLCPLSNLTGEGFDGFFDALNQVVASCEDRPTSGPFRVWVEDVFTIRGPGTVITGIPTSGRVRAGDRLTLWPPGLAGHVRRLQVYGEDAPEARAGECVALNLPEIDHLAARRGMVLCAADALTPATMAEAELLILGSVKGQLDDFSEAHLHIGTASVLARVALLETTEMTAGQKQMVQLRLAQPLPLLAGERYVLRASLAGQGQSGLITVGGGRILGVSNRRLRRKKQWTLQALAARREALDDPASWCELMLRESRQPLAARELEQKCFLRPEELAALLETLRARGRVVRLPSGALAHGAVIEETAARMLAAIASFHDAHPQRAGIGRDELLCLLGESPEICDLAAESLLDRKQVERPGPVFARVGWSARLSEGDQGLSDQVAGAFQQAGWAAPAPAELALSLNQPADRLEKMMQLLAERGVLVRLDQRTFIHRDALEAAKQVALRLFAQKPSFSTMEFRDALAVSRKYAVPLLDYLDKMRFTVRSGHNRTPGVEARKLVNSNSR
ncbi:MAG: selenocysteine-specific translation elongation factor [Verrucomicrobiota bacterium]|jgi:selenocysteine-specific elongation factor